MADNEILKAYKKEKMAEKALLLEQVLYAKETHPQKYELAKNKLNKIYYSLGREVAVDVSTENTITLKILLQYINQVF